LKLLPTGWFYGEQTYCGAQGAPSYLHLERYSFHQPAIDFLAAPEQPNNLMAPFGRCEIAPLVDLRD
jgi:hypothetical protein